MVLLIIIYDTISYLFYNVKYDFDFLKGNKNDSFSQFTNVYNGRIAFLKFAQPQYLVSEENFSLDGIHIFLYQNEV